MVILLFSSFLVQANTWLLFPGSWTNSEALRSVRPTVVFGKIPLSSWGEDESNRLVLRRKIRPSKERLLGALVVADADSLVEDSVVDEDEVDDASDDDDDDDVGADEEGEKKLVFRRPDIDIYLHDWLELEVVFWKLPWTKW